jgi:uncharacterized protein
MASNKDIFVLPTGDDLYLVYMPLKGIIFKGNGASVSLFRKAAAGDKKSLEMLGLTTELQSPQLKNHPSPAEQNITRFRPTSLSVFLTDDCTMRCVYCYAEGGSKKSTVKTEYLDTAIDFIISNALAGQTDNISVSFHGGDISAAWEQFENFVKKIKSKTAENNLNVSITCGLNGMLNQYQRLFVVNNINSATVSLDGPALIHDKLRPLADGSGSFSIVDETLRFFDSVGFDYAIRTTVTADTVRQLDNIIGFFCSSYKVRKIKAEPVFSSGRAKTNTIKQPSVKDFVSYFIKAERTAASMDRELLYSGARFDTVNEYFCQAAGNSFGLTSSGHITSCYEVIDKENQLSDTFFYGSVVNGKVEIDDEKLKALYKLNVNRRTRCDKCFARYHCSGDCPAKVLSTEGKGKVADYRCMINRELTKAQLLKAIE